MTARPASVALPAADAVELAHAWVHNHSRSVDARALLIKGPTLSHHGLRAARVSADVDILVHPADFDSFISALETSGWRRREATFAADRYTLHSVTFLADGWPCDVDVHRYYPGFLTDPTEAFDTLWERRTTMDLGHVTCDIPDRTSAILILALHSVRSTSAQQRHVFELEDLIERVRLSESERAELGELAAQTGCEQTLAEVLPRLDVHVDVIRPPSPELTEWRRRVSSGSTPTYMWFSLLRRSSWNERLAIVRHAIWPTRRDLALMYPGLTENVGTRLIARVRRLGRGVRGLYRSARSRTSQTSAGPRDPSHDPIGNR